MHALIETEEAAKYTGGEFQRLRARLVEGRVVDAQLEIHMRARQLREQLDVVERKQLVDDHPHLDPAPRRLDQFVQYQIARIVRGEEEGLHVDARVRGADQMHAQQQRVFAAIEQIHVMRRRIRRGFAQCLRGQILVGRGDCAGIVCAAGARMILRRRCGCRRTPCVQAIYRAAAKQQR